jgi:hypothetical protein
VNGEGTLIAGRYRLISRLGSGAMGVVWQACDERLHRTVAIKQLVLPSGLSDIGAEAASWWAMREGRITARVQHPHVIALHDVVEHNGYPCLIMEITDFGVSHAVGDVTVSATGILIGTPAYLAPEVAQGDNAGFPSDVFSLGSTLYTALEGTPPFGLSDNADNAIALLHRVAAGEITPPRQSGPLTPLLLRLLERNPEQRPTVHQAHDALATLAAGLAGSPGGLSAPTLPLPRPDPPFEPVPRSQRTLLRPAAPEQTTSPARPTRVDAAAGGPPTTGTAEAEGEGWPGHPQFLVGAMAVVLLATSVLVTMFVGRGTVTSGHATALASTSGIPAGSLQTLPPQPGPSGPTPVITPTTPVIPDSSQDTAEQLPRTITDYHAPMPGNPPVATNRLTANSQQNHVGDFTEYQIQRQQNQTTDQLWARYRGRSGKNRHVHHGH